MTTRMVVCSKHEQAHAVSAGCPYCEPDQHASRVADAMSEAVTRANEQTADEQACSGMYDWLAGYGHD